MSEVKEKPSEEVTCERQQAVNTLPDELQRTTDKRDPLREHHQKQPSWPTEELVRRSGRRVLLVSPSGT